MTWNPTYDFHKKLSYPLHVIIYSKVIVVINRDPIKSSPPPLCVVIYSSVMGSD